MPKKPFSFEVTGRELFDSERAAVDGFVRRYASDVVLVGVRSVEVKHTRVVRKPSLSSKAVTEANKRITALKAVKGKRSAKKVTGTLSSKAAKAVIFGLTTQPAVKAAVARPKRQAVKAANAEPVAVRSRTSRTV